MLEQKNALLLTICLFGVSLVHAQRIDFETDAKPQIPEGWAVGRDLRTDELLPLTFAVKKRNVDELREFVDMVSDPDSPNYGQYKTHAELIALTSPSREVMEVVANRLRDFGALEVSESVAGYIHCMIRVEKAEQLLAVKFYQFVHHETKNVIIRAKTTYSLPEDLGKHIQLVGGVFRFPRIGSFKVSVPDAQFKTTPDTIRSMYNVTIPSANSKNFQAVTSFLNQFFSPDDLTKFENEFDVAQVGIAKVLGPNDANFPGTEASLDVQYLLGVGNGTVTQWVWSTGGKVGSNEPWLTFLDNVSSNSTVPYLFSMSYQDYEYTVSQSYADQCNQEFMSNSARGITFITGSGDWGVGCQKTVSCTYFVADWPSSSPYVTSTGATTLDSNQQEIGVSFSSGGFSNYFTQPSYQTTAVNGYLSQSTKPPTTFYNTSGRGFPDVSAIGVNFQVVKGGVTINVAGTSASTPTFGSLLSLINSLRLARSLPTLGAVNAFLYKAAQQNPSAFKDITSNEPQDAGCCPYSFKCVAGWDPMSGLGTPNFGILSQLALSSNIFPSFKHRAQAEN